MKTHQVQPGCCSIIGTAWVPAHDNVGIEVRNLSGSGERSCHICSDLCTCDVRMIGCDDRPPQLWRFALFHAYNPFRRR
eukprot:scaffold56_cov390-Pavlova_lutheri.AAC.1